MTRITMDWDRLELTAEGHAGAAEKGRDIVCAGISAIMTCLGQYMLRYELVMRPALSMQEGESKIRGRPLPGWRRRTRAAFRQAADGLAIMAESYPDYVTYEEVH